MANKVNFDDMKRVSPREGVNRRTFSGRNSMVVLNEIEPFAQPALHSHPHEQITTILQGECDFILGEETIRMRKGDVILIPPNVRHTLRPVGGETILNLDVFSPVREEYLV
jgi:quercetin dioxygenase-like cupin family protein